MKIKTKEWGLCSIWVMTLWGCTASKHISTIQNKKTQIAEYSKGDLKYKLYQMPNDLSDKKSKNKKKLRSVKLSLMIINMKDNSSPLRRLCTDINQYNIYYEYLLNTAKNELYLRTADKINYPVYYSFENNYNAFPFETINVGYALEHFDKKHTETTLVFVDRVFSKDTLFFNLSKHIK
jgi:hypothetical protein